MEMGDIAVRWFMSLVRLILVFGIVVNRNSQLACCKCMIWNLYPVKL